MSDSVGGRKQTSFGSRKEVSPEKGASSSDATASPEDEAVRYKKVNTNDDSASKDSTGNKVYSYSCDACRNVGDHVGAHGFCNDCKEYLCDTCFLSHSRNKLSKDHTLLDKDVMPRHCDPCHAAGDAAEAVGYCQDCKEYLCDSCHKSHSRSKLSMHHKLVKRSDCSVTASTAKMTISKRDTGDMKRKEEYTFVSDINIKEDTDENDCFITDMALISNTELILCDFENKALKFVDIEQSKIKRVSRLDFKPRGVAVMSNNQIAVVTDQKVIVFLSILEKPTVLRHLKKEGDCVNLELVNEKLYVSFRESISEHVKFQIIKPTGAKVRTIKPNSEVRRNCTLPRHIAVSPDESFIYVSDCDKDKVMSVGADGSLISMYRGELQTPRDIKISPFGSVYVCNTYQHIVYKMTPDLSKATLMLGPGDGMFYPQTMCFNTDKQHLYISSGIAKSKIAHTCTKYANCIKVFKWK